MIKTLQIDINRIIKEESTHLQRVEIVKDILLNMTEKERSNVFKQIKIK